MDGYTMNYVIMKVRPKKIMSIRPIFKKWSEVWDSIARTYVGIWYGWNDDTCFTIIRNNDIESLKYAHQNGCVWDETKYIFDENTHTQCLQYLRKGSNPHED